MKKKSNPIWKVIFITLLIVNLIFGFSVLSTNGWYLGLEDKWVVYPILVILSIIDCIAVISYIAKEHPHGKAIVVCVAVLTIINLVLFSALLMLFYIKCCLYLY